MRERGGLKHYDKMLELTDRQTDRQRDRRADRQTDGRADREGK